MGYEKYYENLYQNEKLNNKFVTYLSAIDMKNSLVNRDILKNNIIVDVCSNYAKKSYDFYNKIIAPLGFIHDDIQVIYDYVENHIDNILEKPNQSIIKEEKLINKEKIKQIEPKTFNWLANKPGSTIKEKMVYVNKISSPVKRFSYNIKENQITSSLYRKLSKLMISKILLIDNNPNLFGNSSEETLKLKRKINKIKYKFKTEFDEVVIKDYVSPNNALLGNKEYLPIWKSYLDLKQGNIDYSNSFTEYKKSFMMMLISMLMNKYDFVVQNLLVEELENAILYKLENNLLTEITFNDRGLIIKKYSTLYVAKQIESTNYFFRFEELKKESSGGVPFELFINDESVGEFNADNLGFKNAFLRICEFLSLESNNKVLDNEKDIPEFLSLNSLDNMIYPSNKSVTSTFNNLFYRNNDIYFANSNIIQLNDYKNEHVLKYLRLFNKNNNSTIIYDINDNYDEFSSTELRRNVSSIFSKSYPVWRSILLGESIENKEEVEFVVDMCGSNKSLVVSRLERKENRFVHCGSIETPLYLQKFNEHDFLNEYLIQYQNKYNVLFPNDVKESFIKSGKLNLLLYKKMGNSILLFGSSSKHNYFVVSFDKDIFNDLCFEFLGIVKQITTYYDKNKIYFIVPNFLNNLENKRFICNKELYKGAKIISQRVDNNEITWYEKLPKLSLEIMKNGMFDNLILIENNECENIIGKSVKIDVQDEFILKKGEKNYILPLNKSFIGDDNESFVALAEDKTFPLENDIKVKLRLFYCFGLENSYLLKFIPVDSAPFKEITIKWEKEKEISKLIYPKIMKKSLDLNFEKNIKRFESNCEFVNKSCEEIKNRNFNVNKSKLLYNDIKTITSLHQDLTTYGMDMNTLNLIMYKHNFLNNLKFLHGLMISRYKKEKDIKYKDIDQWNLEYIECAMVECFRDINFFNKKYLMFPEVCYGWYFSYKYDDTKVISNAYNSLIEMSQTNNYLSSKKLRMHFQSLTSAATNNYKAIYNLSKVNSTYVMFLLKIIIKIMKEMSEYDYSKPSEDKNNNPKENAYLMRYCIEILISYLFLRELPQFKELMPSGKYSKEIINYLKVFNKKYKSVTNWYGKDPNMKSKYNLNISSQPVELNNMLPEIYCLILYLSGDERANLIKIGD